MLDFRQFRQFSKILSSKQKFSDREWTEMIADDHVLNVEMPRFPNLFNISIFWQGANANRSSLLNSLHSYRFINPVSKQKSQIAEKMNHWDANYQADWMHESIKFFDFSLICPILEKIYSYTFFEPRSQTWRKSFKVNNLSIIHSRLFCGSKQCAGFIF